MKISEVMTSDVQTVNADQTMFDDCPTLDDVSVIPVDANKDGRFEQLLFVASPYVAGPWVEGTYEIELSVNPDLIAALKAEFKPSFKA